MLSCTVSICNPRSLKIFTVWMICITAAVYTFHIEFETLNEDHEVGEDQNMSPEINDSQNGENDRSDNSSDDEEPVGNTARYRKRKLTYQMKVYSIDSVPDDSNYEAMAIPENVKKLKTP